jgi:hypothetical protein
MEKNSVVAEVVVLRSDSRKHEYVGLGNSVCMLGPSLIDLHSARQTADCVINGMKSFAVMHLKGKDETRSAKQSLEFSD